MVQMALVFVGFTLFILLLLLLATIYYVPKALESESHHEETDSGPSNSTH